MDWKVVLLWIGIFIIFYPHYTMAKEMNRKQEEAKLKKEKLLYGEHTNNQ